MPKKTSRDDVNLLKNWYQEGEYQKIVDYMLQNKHLYDPSQYHYNLGSTFAKMGELPGARYHLEKSLNLGYDSFQVENNIGYVKEKLGLKEPSFSIVDKGSWLNFSTSLPMEAGASFSLLVVAILLVAYIKEKISSVRILVLGSLVGLIPFAGLYWIQNNYHPAVILESISMREGPSKIFEEAGELPPGEKIIVGRSSGSWFYIVYPKDYAGWVSSKGLGFL